MSTHGVKSKTVPVIDMEMPALMGVTNTAIRRNKMTCRNLMLFIAYFCSFNQLPVPVIDF